MSLTAVEIALVKKNARNVQFSRPTKDGGVHKFLAWAVSNGKRRRY